MTRTSSILLIGALVIATPAAAQDGGRPARPAPEPPARLAPAPRPTPPSRGLVAVTDDANAQVTQQRLRELMQQYPPSLAQVMSIDPTLATNPTYLAPYPVLAAFLAQHPEISHNPRYFFGEFRERNYDYNDPKLAAVRSAEEVLAGIGFLIAFLTVVGTIAFLLRSVIEHRKWLRVSKTHTDTHTKLMDRLTSNEDLIAYMHAIREASRPVTVAQGVAVLFTLTLACAAGWRAWPLVRDYATSASLAQMPAFASSLAIPMVVALGALLIVAPLALYVVLSDE